MEFVKIPCDTDLNQILLFPQPGKLTPKIHGIRRFITLF